MILSLISSLRLLEVVKLIGIVIGCTTFFQQSLYAQNIPTSELANRQLPPAKKKITAAVHQFQNASSKNGQTQVSSLPATTSDNTTVLLKALEESGWFTPVVYDNASKLLNKNTTIRPGSSSLTQGEQVPIGPSADIFLDSGILSYNSNLITYEDGLQGQGSTDQYTQSRATVYLRAVSTKSGKIIETIYSSKAILSQPVAGNSFRYISFKRPLEAETGLTISPSELAVKEAIQKAVEGLIIEGVRDSLWSAADNSLTAMTAVINDYEQAKTNESEIDLIPDQARRGRFATRPQIDAPFISISPYGGIMRYTGDYTKRDTKGTYGLSAEMYLTPALGIQLNVATGTMSSQDAFSVNITSLEANVVLRPLPYQRWTPIAYGGLGVVSRTGSTPFQLYGTKYGQAQGGIGVQFSPNKDIGFRSIIGYSQPFTDSLDGKIMGNHKDYYMRVTLGLVIHLGRFQRKINPIKFTQVAPQNK